MNRYLPEGKFFGTKENKYYLHSKENFVKAIGTDIILESRAQLCDSEHNIIVEFPFGRGIIPRDEGAVGISEGTTKDIALLSRVNKMVCFTVTGISTDSSGETVFTLSRRQAQQACIRDYISNLYKGDVIPARVTHLEPFGAFVDIGCGISSLIPIDAISVSRISHPSDRFFNGQDIFAVVKDAASDRISLSHKELLGTWEENAAQFSVGDTVGGVVRSVEDYGIFIELAPNLAGLAELRENVCPGQAAGVYIKAIIPDKMKVKLIIVDVFDAPVFPSKINYFVKTGRIDKWIYSTEKSEKNIFTDFT